MVSASAREERNHKIISHESLSFSCTSHKPLVTSSLPRCSQQNLLGHVLRLQSVDEGRAAGTAEAVWIASVMWSMSIPSAMHSRVKASMQ